MATKKLSDFSAKLPDGRSMRLDSYAGKTLLVVNVASKCGLTPQYDGLEAMYQKYRDKGLVVLGFPCNQFGGQEPGTDAEIATFCSRRSVTFPVFSKIDVNGKNTDPLYAWMKKEKPGFLGLQAVKWNFTKFLIGKDGRVLKRFAPTAKPEDIAAEVEKAL